MQAKTVLYQRKDIFSFDNIVYNSIFYNPSKNLIYLFNNQNVQTINVQTGVLSKVITMSSVSGKNFRLNQEDPDNIYFVGEDQIEIYDAVTLTLRQTLLNTNYPTDRFVGVTSGYGKYYVTMYGNLTKVKVFDAASKALLKTYNTGISMDYYMGIRILPGQKRLIAFSSNNQDDEAILFNLDDNGNIISHNKIIDNTFPFSDFLCSIAPNGENIVLNKGYVMNKDLKQIGTVPIINSSNGISSYSPDGLYLLTNNGFSSYQIIDMRNLQIIKNIPFKNNSSFNFNFIVFLTNTEYISLGELFLPNGGRRIIISKTKFL